MKGKMKKVFAALLTATVLIGGMPVNMQANVIAEAEKTESASTKVNEKYADTEEQDLMDRERQEMPVSEQEKKENTEQTEPGEAEQLDTDVEQEETAQPEIEEETEEIEELAETEEQAKETEKQEEKVQPDTEEQSEEAAQQENEEQQDKTEQPEMEEQPEETEQPETEAQPEETDTELPEMEEETEEQEEISSSGTVKSTKDFYYTQEFPEGLKVTLSADKGIVPDDAKVNMELVENERLDHLKTEIREQMEALAEEKAQEDERSIFNMYSDLQVSVEDTYALDIKITYTDKAGNICIYEPKKDQSIQVALEQTGFSDIAGDELSEVNLFYTSDISENEYRSASAQGAEENTDIELLDDNLDVEGESICFQAEHFSVYVVSVVKYAGNASEDQIAAEQKAWNLINKYADPDYYLTDPKRDTMTDSQYEELRQEALKVVNGCTTQYEKIKAITAFVADRTYYDCMNYDEGDQLFIDPYEVYIQKRTVCSGYARLMRTLLISIGIPCADLYGDDHEYNAVYDSDNQKWIFADATWCSWNTYTEEGKWQYNGYSFQRFDLTPKQIAELSNHEVYSVDGLLKNGLYYSLVTSNDVETWSNGDWCLSLSGVKKTTKIKCENGFEGLKVRQIKKFAFWQCSTLKEVDLSQTEIAEIETASFYKCNSLKMIKLSKKTTNIGKGAFWGCDNLKYVITNLKRTDINADAFDNYAEIIVSPYVYEIKYDGNGATKGKMSTKACAAGQKEKLSKNKFEKKGYTFAGWNTQPDGKGTFYEENAYVKNLTKKADEVVTLYAQWKAAQYQITYNLNGGKNNKKNPKTYKITSKTIKLSNPSKKGYVFKGWYCDKKCTKKVTSIKKGSTGKVTLYAKWAKEKYTITYKLNGGKNNKKNPKIYTITSKMIKLAAPTRKGYVFKGWYRDKKCTRKVTSIKKGSTGKITLYAKWKKK